MSSGILKSPGTNATAKTFIDLSLSSQQPDQDGTNLDEAPQRGLGTRSLRSIEALLRKEHALVLRLPVKLVMFMTTSWIRQLGM